jgi:dCTP deaminase
MTVLKHEDLREAIFGRGAADALVLTPLLDESQITEATVDLRLGTEFLVLRRTLKSGLDPRTQTQAELEDLHERIVVPIGHHLWLHPGHFLLAATLEYLRVPKDLSAYVLGRSSWGRVGLIVATAIMIQPGFTGSLTLELVNDGDSPICLYPGTRVAQLAVHTLNGPTELGYGPEGKYRAPIGPQPSRLAKESREIAKFEQVNGTLRERLSRRPDSA